MCVYPRQKGVEHVSNLLRGPRGILVVLALVGIIALAGVAVAFAAGGDDDGDGDGGEQFKGSVAAPAENGDEGSHDEAAEARQLQDLAKIDQSAAEKAALQAVPGTVESAELEEENGYVVYEVQVAGDDGQDYHVDVDAGNGKVLHKETGEGNEFGDESDEEGGE
jgi:hypothetical protein